MSRPRANIDIHRAHVLRDEGKSWDFIADYFDVSPSTLRDHMDPARKKQKYAQQRIVLNHTTQHRAKSGEIGVDEALARTLIPVDKRDWHQKFFGDPDYSRSALGRKPAR